MILFSMNNLLYSILYSSPTNFAQSYAAVSLIVSFCEYQYTLRAWRKDVVDIFYDNDFFLMNFDSLSKWKLLIDNLMTKDKAAFGDLLRKFYI